MRLIPFGVALTSGIVLAFAFPEADLAPLTWVALVPFLLVARGASWGRGAGLGFLFGAGFFGTLLSWTTIVGYVGWAALVLSQAAFLAVFGALWALLSRTVGGAAATVSAAAGLWGLVEYGRAHFPVGGFPWGQLAQSQHNLEWMLRPATIGGAIFLSMWLAGMNALVAELFLAFRARRWQLARSAGAFLAALLILPFGIRAPSATGDAVRVAIVQGNVPPIPPSFEKDIQIARSHSELTRELDTRPDLVVWPESALGLDPETTPEMARALADAATAVDAPMLVGANSHLPDGRYRVLLYQVSPEGDIVDRYQKTHLVPFGEYVPFRAVLGWIPMLEQIPFDAIAGSEAEVFEVAGGRIAPVISFEGDFGSLVRDRIAAGGRILVVATNTSTWGFSWTSAQHLAFSRLRAVENGVWVVHAAISGTSAFVRPDGAVFDRTELYEATATTRNLRFAEDVTFYARAGDRVVFVTWVVLGAIAALGALRRRRIASAGA